jgi:hypothetical protein
MPARNAKDARELALEGTGGETFLLSDTGVLGVLAVVFPIPNDWSGSKSTLVCSPIRALDADCVWRREPLR